MHEPFFNIVIPTRGRSQTIKWTLKTCLEQDYGDYLIIVCDNCSEDDTREVVKSFDSELIRYVRTPCRLSMSHNWEFARKFVEPGYVMYLGDDDGLVTRSLARLAAVVRKFPSPAYRLSNAVYYWDNPNAKSKLMSNVCHNVVLDDQVYWVESRNLINSLRHSLDYHSSCGFLKLPSIYHGLLHTDLINTFCVKSEKFFKSNCPDMFSALAATVSVDRFVHYQMPTCINGLSQSSNGLSASRVNQRRDQEVLEIDSFISDESIPIDPRLMRDERLMLRQLAPFSLFVADQFFKIQSVDKNFLVPSIDDILRASMRFAVEQSRSPSDFESYIECIKHVAEINDRSSMVQALRKEFEISRRRICCGSDERVPRFDFDVKSRTATIDTKHLGLENVYDVSRMLEQLIVESTAPGFVSPKGSTRLTGLEKMRRTLAALSRRFMPLQNP